MEKEPDWPYRSGSCFFVCSRHRTRLILITGKRKAEERKGEERKEKPIRYNQMSVFSDIFLIYTFKKPNKSALLTLLTCSVLCLGIAGCGGGEESPAPESKDKKKPIAEDKKNESKKKKEKPETKTESDKDKKGKESKSESDDSSSKKTFSNKDIESFLKRTEKSLDKNLRLPKTIQKAASEFEMEHGKRKKWRGNHVLVTVDSQGSVMDTKFETEVPSIEFQDINDAIEDAIEEARPFSNPPAAKGKSFTFRIRLWGKKTYVTEYKEGEKLD